MRFFMLAAALVAAPAAAADLPANAPPKEKKICQPAQTTGSRLGARKICKTAAEWQRDREQSDKDLDLRRRSDISN